MIATPGELHNLEISAIPGDHLGGVVHRSAEVDEEYLVIGGHVEPSLEEKITQFHYIDFAKLLPKDRIARTEDNPMELVFKNGTTYFTPVADRETSVIGNFNKWEQAFCIYSKILTKAHPAKAGELIQYNHVIYTAALTFCWDNVYAYDREFHMHISKFPSRNWGVILQQAWSMCLKDRIRQTADSTSAGNQQQQKNKSSEICHRFNKGKCTYGMNCRYQHRCSLPKCGKYGHGAHICRRRHDANSGWTESGKSPTVETKSTAGRDDK